MRVVTQVFATKVADYAVRFVTSVLIARYLGPSDKGVMTFAQLVVNWVVTFGNLSIYDANIFLLGSRRYDAAQATATTFALSVVSGIVYAGVLFAVVFFQWVHWPVGQPVVIYLFALTIPFTLVSNNAIAILQGLNRFDSFNVQTLLRSIAAFVGVLVVIAWVPNRLMGFVYAGLVTTIASTLVLAFYLGREAKWHFRISMPYLKEAFLFGVRGHLRVLLVQFSLMFDQFLLGAMLAPAYLGWYSVAVGLSQGLIMLPDSVAMVLFPRVAGDQKSAGALTARACRCTLMVMVVAAAVGVAVGRPGIQLLYGEQFLPAISPFQLLLAAMIFQSASRVLRNYLYGMGRPQLTLWSAGAAALVTLVAMYPLVKEYGMIGAAVAGLLAHGVGAVVDLALASRVAQTPTKLFIVPQRADLRLAAWKP